MFERSTKIWLVVYLLYTLAYLTFVRRPAPPYVPASEPRPLAQPEGADLFHLAVLPSETRAIAGMGTEEGGELWLIDWTRIDEWLRGDASLADLAIARMPAHAMAWSLSELEGGGVALLFGDAETGIEWARWHPPDPPERRAVPPDTSWVNDEGRVFTTGELEQRLAENEEFPPRPWPGLAAVGDGIAYTRTNAGVSTEFPDRFGEDDFLIFNFDTGELIVEVDTVVLAWANAISRFPGVLYATNDATSLEAWVCDAERCGPAYGGPYLGADLGVRGGGIRAADVAPSVQRAALCGGGDRVVFYAFDPWSRGGTVYLGSQELPEACEELVIIDERRVIVSQEEQNLWLLVEFDEIGGWL